MFPVIKFHPATNYLYQEKDSYVDMWQNATVELEKLQDFDRVSACV